MTDPNLIEISRLDGEVAKLRAETDDLRDRLRVAEAMRDDARAASARDLESRRAMAAERDAAVAELEEAKGKLAAYLVTYIPEPRPSSADGGVGSPDTLGDALPREMARVRDMVLPAYLSVGQPGEVGVALMRADLDRAARALAEGDCIAMLHAHRALKEYKL